MSKFITDKVAIYYYNLGILNPVEFNNSNVKTHIILHLFTKGVV